MVLRNLLRSKPEQFFQKKEHREVALECAKVIESIFPLVKQT
jgi:hypothetical protein